MEEIAEQYSKSPAKSFNIKCPPSPSLPILLSLSCFLIP